MGYYFEEPGIPMQGKEDYLMKMHPAMRLSEEEAEKLVLGKNPAFQDVDMGVVAIIPYDTYDAVMYCYDKRNFERARCTHNINVKPVRYLAMERYIIHAHCGCAGKKIKDLPCISLGSLPMDAGRHTLAQEESLFGKAQTFTLP
jgi:hypothetical protein